MNVIALRWLFRLLFLAGICIMSYGLAQPDGDTHNLWAAIGLLLLALVAVTKLVSTIILSQRRR
jgi:hypothetical protein